LGGEKKKGDGALRIQSRVGCHWGGKKGGEETCERLHHWEDFKKKPTYGAGAAPSGRQGGRGVGGTKNATNGTGRCETRTLAPTQGGSSHRGRLRGVTSKYGRRGVEGQRLTLGLWVGAVRQRKGTLEVAQAWRKLRTKQVGQEKGTPSQVTKKSASKIKWEKRGTRKGPSHPKCSRSEKKCNLLLRKWET